MLVPKSVTLPVIVGSSKFRSRGRFPTLSFYCKENHVSLAAHPVDSLCSLSIHLPLLMRLWRFCPVLHMSLPAKYLVIGLRSSRFKNTVFLRLECSMYKNTLYLVNHKCDAAWFCIKLQLDYKKKVQTTPAFHSAHLQSVQHWIVVHSPWQDEDTKCVMQHMRALWFTAIMDIFLKQSSTFCTLLGSALC